MIKPTKNFVATLSILILFGCTATACSKENTTDSSLISENSNSKNESVSAAPTFDSSKSMSELSKTGTMDSGIYTSANGNLQITLPDETWKNTGDIETYISFISGNNIITITHIGGAGAAPLFENIPATPEDYLNSLGNESPLYEVLDVSYNSEADGAIQWTKALLKVLDPSSLFKREITYTCYLNEEVYIVSAKLVSEEEAAIQAVSESVYSFQVLTEHSFQK